MKHLEVVALTVIIWATLVLAQSVRSPGHYTVRGQGETGDGYDLGITPQVERKDTKMLCLEGCPLQGLGSWDTQHVNASAHVSERCIRAAICMVNSYFGGNLSQDRVSYYVYGEYLNESADNDLGHGTGIVNLNLVTVLKWALNEASVYRINGKPGFDEIQYTIDSNRPMIRDHGEAHMITVIDGYDTEGQLVHVIDPLTGTETRIPYDNLDVFVVWAPTGEAITARSDEPTIWMDSDGDGVVDFDETSRFHTDPYENDTDGDGIDDKTEIRSYTFLSDDSFDSLNVRKPDADEDGLRAELDQDSDDGGRIDGLEDVNRNGRVDLGETDPFDPTDDTSDKPSQNLFEQITPWIGIGSLITVTAVSVVYVRRRNARQRQAKKQRRHVSSR